MMLLKGCIAFYIAVLWNGIEGCGIATHIEVAHRAQDYFDGNVGGIDYQQMLRRHNDAFQAGSPYPDAYYPDLCREGMYHSVAEDTHWTPFLNVSINYIRRTYPKPWSEETEKLVVFLMAIVMHQVSDVNWHSLGINQGFLRTMGKVNYHGSFSEAHSDGDFGGDVLNAYQLNRDYIDPIGNWYVPVQDLMNIYNDYYGPSNQMTPDVIEECTELLYLGRLGESLGVIEELVVDYAEASPFLMDQLNGFFLGGIDDMVVWTQNVWRHTMHMLDKGTHICELPNNPIFIKCNYTSGFDVHPMHKPGPQPTMEELELKNPGMSTDIGAISAGISLADLVKVRTARGISLSPSHGLKKKIQQRYAPVKVLHMPEEKARETLRPLAYYTTNLIYSRLGENILTGDLNNDGSDDLVISAPVCGSSDNYQQGRVYIIYGTNSGLPVVNLTIETAANITLSGPKFNSRFGSGLAIVDLNADGINDLAVSAPQVGSPQLTYNGEVYVYYGRRSGGFDLGGDYDVTIGCPDRYCNLGYTLTSGDLNGDGRQDLIIGAPFAPAGGEQRGFVGVLLSNASLAGKHDLTVSDLDWVRNGDQDYGWFGYSASVATVGSSSLLLVGSPTTRLCERSDCSISEGDTESVGRISIYKAPLGPDSTPAAVMTGAQKFAQMGFTLTSGSPYGNGVQMAQAQVSFDSTGMIDWEMQNFTQPGLVSLHSLSPDGTVDAVPLVNFVGDREIARTGATLMLRDVTGDQVDDLLLSMPLRTEDVDREAGAEEGRVYIFTGGTNFPRGNATFDCDIDSQTVPCLKEKADFELVYGEEKARFGSSLGIAKFGNRVQMAVGAPHSNDKDRLTGMVALFQREAKHL